MDEEEEEEIQSQSQSQSPPPHALPHPNSRLSLAAAQPVTVAAAPPQHTLTLALPIQQSRPTGGGGGGGGGGREDCWSDGATSTLIDAWGERYLELSRGNLKQKHWQDVADIVSSRQDYTKPAKTDVQCKNRIDTLKKKYKVEKAKIAQGQGPSNWPFFHTLDRLIGANTNITAPLPLPTAIPSPLPPPGTKVPVGIPVGITTFPNPSQHQHRQHPHSLHQHQHQHQQRKQLSRKKPGSVESGSTGSDAAGASPDSSDSFPPQTFNRKRPRIEKEMNSEQTKPKRQSSGKSNWGNSISELTRAILEFGECYERAETSKLQQMVEMEKQRIGFAKDLELQRMQFFMKTQLELSQLKHGSRRVGSSDHHHNNSNNRNHSD